MSKHKGHTGHKHEIAKAHGHVPDPEPKGNKAFPGSTFLPTIGHDKMAHATHHAANAHHKMSGGMGPEGEHGTVSPSVSHLGCNECSEDESGEGTRDADHMGGESSEG